MKKTTSTPLAIQIPLINPNELDVRLVSLNVANDQYVDKNVCIATVETTKSTQDIMAEMDGYITHLRFKKGDHIKVGEILCYIAESPGCKLPEEQTGDSVDSTMLKTGLPSTRLNQEGKRITEPAYKLANKYKIDLSEFPPDLFITEQVIRNYLEFEKNEKEQLNKKYDPASILVYGGGGHGKSLIELIQSLNTYNVVGIIDDHLPIGEQILGFPVLGGVNIMEKYYQLGIHNIVNAVGGIGDLSARTKIFEILIKVGFEFPALAHPTSYLEPSAKLSAGAQIMPHVYIGSEAQIGFGVIINTGAIISHDCIIGDYSNISPGAVLAGGVVLGAGTLIGMGATINIQVIVGKGVRVGNNATIKSDIPADFIVRAGSIWPDK